MHFNLAHIPNRQTLACFSTKSLHKSKFSEECYVPKQIWYEKCEYFVIDLEI